MRDRGLQFVRDLPFAHRVMIVAAVAVAAVAVAGFLRWVTSPSYTVLYTGLDDASLQQVIDGLEEQGVAYTVEGGGSRVLVPQDQLYETRAALAADGVSGGAVAPPGYELLDEQGVGVSNFKQRVDYQRALEGELAATLGAMDAVNTATVRLVIPEERLFEEDQQPVTASVLLDTARDIDASQVESIAFMVSSSVEGLDVDNVTVADTDGTVLQAPGDGSGGGGTGRLLRQTREFEQALAGDVRELVAAAGGGTASVVVRATMNFDEAEQTRETYAPDSRVSLREDVENERFQGQGTVPGGVAGVDGGPLPIDGATGSDYERDRSTVEYGVDKETVFTRQSPGKVEGLSVAIVMDDGALTGLTPVPETEVEDLVTAALGLDAERGDTVAVSAVPFPEPEPVDEAAGATDMIGLAGRAAAVLVLIAVAVIFVIMLRRRRSSVDVVDITVDNPAQAALGRAPQQLQPGAAGLPSDVTALVDEQPEDIAVLLRSWLADRRV